MLATINNFFASTDDSVKGYVNAEELFRSILTSLGSASTIGIVVLVLQTMLSNASTIFPNPTVAALATGFLTLILDLLRRQNQGVNPVPAPTPIPTPTPTPTPAQP